MGTIGIIGAMEVEVKELKEQMQITRQLTKAGMEFCEGILEGQDVVVVRRGVGKVNAADAPKEQTAKILRQMDSDEQERVIREVLKELLS